MQNRVVSVIVLFWVLFFGFYSIVSAQTPSSNILLNASILSNVWYSTTTINKKDTINIYAGFQNHSTINLSGTAGFYVDDLEINKIKFTSSPKSLVKLESPYTAVSGNHSVQVKILEVHSSSDISISMNSLQALESEKKGLNVKYEITNEVIIDKATDIANNVVNTIDKYASNLASTVESMKTPFEKTAKNQISSQIPKQGVILGTSTKAIAPSTNTEGFSFYNLCMDILAFLIRKWIWVCTAILFFILYMTFKRN